MKGSGKATTAEYSIPWVVYEPGQYVIVISGYHEDGQSRGVCKAAPAIANAYLTAEGIDKKDSGKNVLAEVAKETGKNGFLWAKEKCDEDYFSKTITFILDTVE